MPITTKHISVCICTYKRPDLLRRLLYDLSRQDTGGAFTYSIVVVDNDRLRSAQTIVSDFAEDSAVPILYCHEPRQNIALARNKAVENAEADFIAQAHAHEDSLSPASSGVSAIAYFRRLSVWCMCLGWMFFNTTFYGLLTWMPTYLFKVHGFDIKALGGASFIIFFAGLLLKKCIFPAGESAFRPEFLTGEDQDFFRRMIARGHVFIWCDEAVAYEVVPPVRWKRTFMLRRALLCGKAAVIHPGFGAFDIAKSVIAVPTYILALPCVLILGHHRFMNLLVKLFDHLGKLLALIGISPVEEQYVTD